MAITASIVFACVFGAALLGMLLRRMLPAHHLNSETKDVVKLAMGFVATMSALILGLLVASAKDTYDKQASSIVQMAAKVIYLDRILANFGPETAEVRSLYRDLVERVAKQIWLDGQETKSRLDPYGSHSEELIAAIESLVPTNDLQRALKSEAASICLELGQMRWLGYEQANSTLSMPLLCMLVFWTGILFASFGVFAPNNGTAVVALFLASLSVAGAIFLILELSSPFAGLLQISNTPFVDAISHLGK